MALVRKLQQGRKPSAGGPSAKPLDVVDNDALNSDGLADDVRHLELDGDGPRAARVRRVRQGVTQFPMQILVPEETRNALRQRSEDTGASIRHIILRSLAADGFPVPRLTRKRG